MTFLTRQAGVRQFLDIGTGLPTANNTHEVAQAIAPQCRIVYVDNDPLVLVHARALLTSSPQGATAYLDADLRDTDKILGDADVRSTLDFSRPVAVMLVAILHFIPDEADPYGIVAPAGRCCARRQLPCHVARNRRLLDAGGEGRYRLGPVRFVVPPDP